LWWELKRLLSPERRLSCPRLEQPQELEPEKLQQQAAEQPCSLAGVCLITKVGKGGLIGIGASVAGNVVGKAIGGTTGSVISGAATGAGVGSLFGPLGALAGGVIGAGIASSGHKTWSDQIGDLAKIEAAKKKIEEFSAKVRSISTTHSRAEFDKLRSTIETFAKTAPVAVKDQLQAVIDKANHLKSALDRIFHRKDRIISFGVELNLDLGKISKQKQDTSKFLTDLFKT